MIVILDYGMGNPGSILNMIRRVGGQAVISSDEDSIRSASAIILPGVGSFDNGMQKLNSSGILAPLEQQVLRNRVPFLGICLGMQLLFEKSQEGSLGGLGWVPGEVKRFDFSQMENCGLKIPAMGWNLIHPAKKSPLFEGLEEEARFYFVHSYHVECSSQENSLAVTTYGYPYVSAVQKDNIFGVQFHPEKSHRFGKTLFKNFLEMASC